MNHAIKIGTLEFASKKAAKDYIKSYMLKHADYEIMQDFDFEFARNLLMLHPDAEEKIGTGISRIYIGPDMLYGTTRCFYVKRTDDTLVHFSWLACIDGKKKKTANVIAALRQSIAPYILQFRNEAIAKKYCCLYTNNILSYDNIHIHHKEPRTFDRLLKSYLLLNNITVEDFIVEKSGDLDFEIRLSNEKQKESWVKYHNDCAVLEALSKEGHALCGKNK